MAVRTLLSSDDDGPVASINVVPFIDVVLVILVVFMLTSVAIARASLSVELPRAASGGAHVVSTLNLVYTRSGDLVVNGEPRTRDEATAIVRGEVAKDPRTQAVIAADTGVPYGKVMEVVDLVKTSGITVLALDVEHGVPPALEH